MDRTVVAGYYRVSRARDGMKAPELYEEEIRRYCDYSRLHLDRIYSDIDYSGWKKSEKRPGLQSLVDERHRYDAIIVPKLSRWGRSMRHLVELFDLFDKERIALVFLDMKIDTSTSQGRLLRHVLAAVAEYESEVRSSYSKANARHRAERGLPNGKPPYGFERAKDTLTINETEAAAVRLMFQRFIEGASFRVIADDLTHAGYRTRSGVAWSRVGVRTILDNPSHAGLRRHLDAVYPASWPAIVTQETWDAAQAKRDSQRWGPGRKWTPPAGPYLLSRLISCGHCGRTLYHRTKQDRVPGMYVCRGESDSGSCRGGAISDHRAEAVVEDAMLRRFEKAFLRVTTDDRVRPRPFIGVWQEAGLAERRRIIGLAIDRIETVQRRDVRGRGEPRGRQLAITWAGELAPELPVIPIAVSSPGKACEKCGRRKPLREFSLRDGDGEERSASCGRCRRTEELAADREGSLPVNAKRRKSWNEWRKERLLPF